MKDKDLWVILKMMRDEDWFVAKFGYKKGRYGQGYLDGWDDCLDELMKQLEGRLREVKRT